MLTLPVLTAAQCDAVLLAGAQSAKKIDSSERRPGRLNMEDSAALQRISFKSSLQYLDELPSAVRPAIQAALETAAKHFGYSAIPELHTCSERCQPRVAAYGLGQRFSRHTDVPDPAMAQPAPQVHWIACSIQLDHSEAYDGGDLLVDKRGESWPHFRGSRKRGTAALFLGHHGHEVTPITRGLRRALVLWGNVYTSRNVGREEAERFCKANHVLAKNDRERVSKVFRELADSRHHDAIMRVQPDRPLEIIDLEGDDLIAWIRRQPGREGAARVTSQAPPVQPRSVCSCADALAEARASR